MTEKQKPADKGKKPVAQGRVFALDQETADAFGSVIKGKLLINNVEAFVLIDSGSMHSFISPAYARRLELELELLEHLL